MTRERFRGPDGSVVDWNSRAHRKHANRLDSGRGSTWWAPGAIAWWIGVLFMIGSVCFARRRRAGLRRRGRDRRRQRHVLRRLALLHRRGLLQYLEAVNASACARRRDATTGVRLLTWEPRRIDWWASAVQLVGTVFFNVSTLAAVDASRRTQAHRLVWRPDALGSICFLVASGFAWAEVGHRWFSWRPQPLVVDRGAEPRRLDRVRRVRGRGRKVVPDQRASPATSSSSTSARSSARIGFLVGALPAPPGAHPALHRPRHCPRPLKEHDGTAPQDAPTRDPLEHQPALRPIRARRAMLRATHMPDGRDATRHRVPGRARRADARRQRAAEPRDVRHHVDGAAGAAAHGRDVRQEHDRQGRVPAHRRPRDAVREHARPGCGTRPTTRRRPARRRPGRARRRCSAGWR